MRWVTCVAAPILLANVGDHRFRAFSVDPKRGDERIFGVHGDAVRLSIQFKPDGELHWPASSMQYFGPDVRRGAVAICVGIEFGAISSVTRLPHQAARSMI
jgi:hypothetical protein